MLRCNNIWRNNKGALALLVLFFFGVTNVNAQLFQQDFNGGAFTPATINCTSGQVTDGTLYRNSTSPSNTQFTYINTSTGTGCGTSISVNTTSGKLEVVKTANNAYLTRSFPFPSNTTSALVRFDFEVLSNGSSNTSAFNFYIGDTILDGNSSSSYKFHTNFKIGIDASNSLGWRVAGTGSFVRGSHTVLLAVNNSGAILNYFGPNGTCESVGDDKYDLWIDNVKYVNDGASSLNTDQTLKRFAIVSASGPSSTCTIDNILIDPIPPTPTIQAATPLVGGGIGFNANWTPVTGVTGYYVDIADDNAFSTNLNTVYVAGATTSSYAFTPLSLNNAYYYRVRSASVYSIGTYQSCNSATASGLASSALFFTTQPSNISECLGVSNSLSVSSAQATLFQWYSNTINSTTTGSSTLVASGPSYTNYTPPSSLAGTTYYYCIISNGSVSLASNVATVTVVQSPTLTGASQSAAVCGGQNATIRLTGLVPGSLNKGYYHFNSSPTVAILADSVAETGGGNGSFLIATTNASNNQVIVIDSIKTFCTTFTSFSVTLIVNPTPSNPTGITNGSSCTVGQSITLSVSAPSTGFTTNWYNVSSGGAILAGGSATNTFITPAFNSDTTAVYYAQYSNSITGCTSPIRVAVTANVGIPVFTFSSNTIYSPLPVATLYNVNLPYLGATGSVDLYDITWTGTSSSLFTNVSNGTLPSTTANNIVVSLNSFAIAGTYTGSIRVKNSSSGCTSNWVPFTLVLIPVAKGDLGSVANGVFTTNTTWRMYSQNSGRFDSSNAAPSSTTNLWIIDGYTVSAPTGGSCKDLHVINGRLKSGKSVSTTGVSIGVNGGVIEVASNGYFGTRGLAIPDTVDALSLNIQNVSIPISTAPVTVIKGTGGYIDLGRLIVSGNNDSIVIDHDMTINYKGTNNNGYDAACNFNAANQKLYIKPTRTVTFDKWSNFSVGSAPATYTNNNSYAFYVDGTLNFTPGIPSTATVTTQQTFAANNGYFCMNTGPNGSFKLIIGSGGTVNLNEFYPNGLTGYSNVNTITNNGTLNIDSLADFRKALQTVTGSGTFNLRGTGLMRIGSTYGLTASGTGATSGPIQTTTRNFSTSGRYSYESRSAQVTGDGIPSTVGALIVRDTLTTLTLSKAIRVNDSIRFNNGRLVLGGFDINSGSVKNYNDTNYVVTNGTGSLKIRNVGNSDVVFPVGVAASSVSPNSFYNPVTLNNIGVADAFAVKVDSIVPVGIAVSPRLDSTIKRGWTIIEEVAGGSNVTVTPQWLSSSQYSLFSNSYCAVIHSNGSIIDAAGSVGPALGSSPYTKYGSGFTSFLSNDKFGVSTSPKKFRSRDSGPWNDPVSWEICNASGGYSPSEVDFPSISPYDVIIQNTHTITTASGTSPIVNNIQIDGLLSTLSDDISVYGNWLRTATGGFDHNNKIVKFVGATNATISASGADEYFPYLNLAKTSLANKITLSDNIKIGKELKISSGTFDLAAKNITLISDSSNTASFASFPSTGAAINYSSTGRFIVQRYIHSGSSGTRHPKSWQLLCAPIDPAENISIKQSWMENAGANLNPNPGFGTQIVGPGGPTNGFDVATTAASIKTYDPTTNLWQLLPNTSQNVNNDKGYMIFVRGSRAVTTAGTGVLADSTTLRAKGKLMTGNIAGPVVPANSFQSIANPYASSVKFDSLTKTNLQGFIWVYDPTLGTLGGFIVIDQAGASTPPSSLYSNPTLSRIIQSGQAFFVHSTASAGSINFKESDKITESHLVLREAQTNSPSLRSSMFYQAADGSYNLSDGNLVMIDEANTNDQSDDAIKFFNSGDNFAVLRNGNSFAIEKRKPFVQTDTVFYNMLVSRAGNYSIKIKISDWVVSSTNVFLIDKYTHTTTPISLSEEMSYVFQINADLASKASDRFMVVFNNTPLAPLPVKFLSVTAAYKNKSDVEIKWTVSNEQNVSKYIIYKSTDGLHFTKVGENINVLNNGHTNSYLFIDANNINPLTYYKVSSIDFDGTVKYSDIVNVKNSSVKNELIIYPNPVINGMINLSISFLKSQEYNYSILNAAGQTVDKGVINLTNNNFGKKVSLRSFVSPGVYTFKIVGEDGDIHSTQVTIK
jgi:hypothetical protein